VRYLVARLKDQNRYHRALEDLVALNAREAIPDIERLLTTERVSWAIDALFQLDARQCRESIYHTLSKDRPATQQSTRTLAILTRWEDSRVYPLVMDCLLSNDFDAGDAGIDG